VAKSASIRAFKCPSCGAPIEPEVGTLTMKCPYCGGTVIIPESLRTPPPSAGPTLNDAFQFGLNGIDLNQIVGNAMQLPEALSLAKQGRVDEAAQIYSRITGMEHEDAVKAVQAMAGGHAVALTPGRPGTNWQTMKVDYSSQPVLQTSTPSTFSGETYTPSATKRSGASCALIVAILACISILAGAILFVPSVFGAFSFFSPLSSIGFANKTLSFGGEGIGQGLFEDARSIGVDGDGNIVVAEYSNGRLQIFDPNGKFVSMFSLGPKTYVQATAVSHNGTIYIVTGGKILIYNESGQQTGEISDDNHDYNDVTLGADGTLYALSDNETIVRFKRDNSIDLEIQNSISDITGDSDIDTHLAVDGLGNMYILGNFTYAVFKYSPQGKFINQFGSEVKGSDSDPAKFQGPITIGVDGYGRIYVDDIFEIKVFDSTGKYISSIGDNDGAVFGMAFDSQNNLYTVSKNKVAKFSVKKPSDN